MIEGWKERESQGAGDSGLSGDPMVEERPVSLERG